MNSARVVHPSKLLITACWLVFLGYWFAASRRTKAVRIPPRPLDLWRHRFNQILSFGLLAGVIPFWPFDFRLWRGSPWIDLAGVAICVSGLAICIWARRALGGNWSAPVTFKEGHELVTHGPYRFVRHPIYTGIILMMVGTVLVLGRLDSFLGLAVRLIVYFFKIRREERLMTEHFPDAYAEYRTRTGALLPFV